VKDGRRLPLPPVLLPLSLRTVKSERIKARNASSDDNVAISSGGVILTPLVMGGMTLPPLTPPLLIPTPLITPPDPPPPPPPLPTPPEPPLVPLAIIATLNSEKGMVSKKLPMGCIESNGLYNIPAP